jgi:hypothetical protein
MRRREVLCGGRPAGGGIALRLGSLKSREFSHRPTTYPHLYPQTIAPLAVNGSNVINARVLEI